MPTIFCTKCGADKPLSEFYRQKLGLHGRAAICKVCDGARTRAWFVANPSKTEAYWRAEAESHPERVRERARRYRQRHPDRIAAYSAAYIKNNPAKRAFLQMTREARKKRAIPAWADLAKVKAIYEACPPGYQVDHIVPIVAKRAGQHVACGLHCEANLQHLSAEDNRRKWTALQEAA